MTDSEAERLTAVAEQDGMMLGDWGARGAILPTFNSSAFIVSSRPSTSKTADSTPVRVAIATMRPHLPVRKPRSAES